MERFRQSIKGVKDPRTSNATRHDFVEMPAISLLSSLCGGQTCVDMADFAADNEAFLRAIMPLLHGPPSHDSFSRVFRRMDPKPFGRALARFAKRWAKALKKDGVRQIAIDGKIAHDRRLVREAQVNIAIRWFIGCRLYDRLPDHSSLTRIRQCWGEARFRTIFQRTVSACLEAGIAKGEVVHVDATLIRRCRLGELGRPPCGCGGCRERRCGGPSSAT